MDGRSVVSGGPVRRCQTSQIAGAFASACLAMSTSEPPIPAESPRRYRSPWWWNLGVLLFCVCPPVGYVLVAVIHVLTFDTVRLTYSEASARQISRGLLIYSSEFDGRLPAEKWQSVVRPHVDSVHFDDVFQEAIRRKEGRSNGFGMNRALLGVQVATMANPESTALIYISHQPGPNAVGGAEDVRFPIGWPFETATAMAMADGSSRKIKKKAFDPSVFRVEW